LFDFDTNLTSARMIVPELAKNGNNSSFGVLVSFEGMNSDYISGSVVNAKKQIITIFDHFRNTHARYCEAAFPKNCFAWGLVK